MNILYVTTLGGTMIFFKDFIKDLIGAGHTVDIICNEATRKVPDCYREWGCKIYSHSANRNPYSKGSIKAIKEIRQLVLANRYDIVHCHTPIAAMCTRLACKKLRKKQGVKVFYTAHGFHFHKTAPWKNWILYYPIEKLCARFTDVLITINQEDYALAKKKMKAKRVDYVPGVGINLSRFKNIQVDRSEKRLEIGVPENAFLLLSVGELNANKNHQVIIQALAKLNDPHIHYAVAGRGKKKENLLELANCLGVAEQVHLLDYRKDIPELNHIADVFCFPSMREGLGLAALEAMACGLPIVTSNVHGINDYSIDGVTGYKVAPTDVNGFADVIRRLVTDRSLREEIGKGNKNRVFEYGVGQINCLMNRIYGI